MIVIHRPAYDSNGMRCATCERCGMSWIESREPVELFPGEWATPGEREHECPDPLPYDTARALLDFHSTSGVPVHPRIKARIKLGLEAGP